MANETQAAPDAIDKREVREQIVFIQEALSTDDTGEQKRIAGEALLRFGGRFLETLSYGASVAEPDTKAALERFNDFALDVFLHWLVGEKLTEREDEGERRAAAALEMLQKGGAPIARIAAEALLNLPEGHPKRDVAAIHSLLMERLATHCRDGAWDDAFNIAETLLRSNILGEPDTAALIADLRRAESEARAAGKDTDVEARASFLRMASLDYFRRSVAAREEGADARLLVATSQSLLEEARAVATSPKDDFALALTLDEVGESERAAELLATIVDNRSEMYQQAAWIEGMIRVRLGHWARAIEVLAPLMDTEERDYLLALDDADITDAGERFSKDAVNLAFAYAFSDRWPEALATIDRLKSPRLRHSRRLRQTPEGKELLRLEAELASARRGAPEGSAETVDREQDPLGFRISRQARLLERYRLKRPDLAAASLAPPTLADLGDALAADEALVCLGSGFRGLLIGIVLRGDRDTPSEHLILEDLTQAGVAELMTDGEELSGWALELASTQPIDPERALAGMLDAADRAFGWRVAELLRAHAIRHVTIVPHRMLHLIPFWALPSLRDFEVNVASSAAQWHESRKLVPNVPPRLAAVGNPTLDLGLARVEAAVVARLLGTRGYTSTLLLDRDATEGAMRTAVGGAGWFHFAGHGLAKPLQPLLSALLAHPDEHWGWPVAGDPLAKLANVAAGWVEIDGGRHADVPQGRLVEHTDEDGHAVERLLEHADRGTLFGSYDEGSLLQLAELWTAADVLIEDVFASCGVAFLGACESGQTALRVDIDEGLGLPGALQAAGVHTVISALWPINDTAALLFAHLFYRRLAAASAGPVDVAGAVRACRRELAALRADAARALLVEMRAHTDHRPSQARLDLAMADLLEMAETPFADPYHWAAYFSLGSETVHLS